MKAIQGSIFGIFAINAFIPHIWTVIIAFTEAVILGGILTFFLRFLSELYWMIKMFGEIDTYAYIALVHFDSISIFLQSLIKNKFMSNKLTKIKNWILASFQFISVGLLVFAIVLILKQQNDISILKSRINSIESNTDNLSSEIEEVKNKLDDVESNLSIEIEDVKRTVRIWSN